MVITGLVFWLQCLVVVLYDVSVMVLMSRSSPEMEVSSNWISRLKDWAESDIKIIIR